MNISASALSTHSLCERKWAWKALDGIQGQNRFAAEGTDHHAELEAWLRDKKLPRSHVVQRALPHFPHPGPDVLPEHRFEGMVRGWHVVGVIDCLHLLQVPLLLDLKTTSDLRWAKTEEELRNDVQAALYAAWACITFEVELVALRWVYVERKKNGRVRAVNVVMSGRQALSVLERFAETADAITRARAHGLHAIDMKPNWEACEQYGGCPYKSNCGPPPLPVEPAMIQNAIAQERNRPMAEMSIAEKMKARIAAQAAPAVNPAPAAASPAPAAVPAPAAAPAAAEPTAPAKPVKLAKPAPALPPAPEKVVEEVLRQHGTVAIDVAHRAFDAAVEHVQAHLDNPPPRGEQPIDLWRAQLLLDVAEKIKRNT